MWKGFNALTNMVPKRRCKHKTTRNTNLNICHVTQEYLKQKKMHKGSKDYNKRLTFDILLSDKNDSCPIVC